MWRRTTPHSRTSADHVWNDAENGAHDGAGTVREGTSRDLGYRGRGKSQYG